MKEASLDTANRNSSKVSLLAWVVWGLAATFYFTDYLARVAPSVMHEHLQTEFRLSELGMGVLNAAFYLPYILMQIPVGLSVDRMSIRHLLTIMSLMTAFGCVVFGLAEGLAMASFGRIMIGFSAAFAFVCALRLATSWFPPVMFGLLAGLTQALGMLGAAAGDAPVSCLVSHLGWRHSMLVIAFLFIILAGLLYQFIRDTPNHNKPKPMLTDTISILQSLKIILTNRQTWINALYAGFLFGPTAVIGENLGPAFLQFGRGFTPHSAAFATSLIFIGWGLSGPVCGWLSDRLGSRKPMMIASALFGIILSSSIVFLPNISLSTTMFLLFAFGATNTGVAIAYAVATELHPPKIVGTSIAFTNMISIFIGAGLQPIIGQLLNLIGGERAFNVSSLDLSDFQNAFILLPCCSLIALTLSFFIKETRCMPIYSDEL